MDCEPTEYQPTEPSSTTSRKRPFPNKGKGNRGKFPKKGKPSPAIERDSSKPSTAKSATPHGGLPEYEKSKKPLVASICTRLLSFNIYLSTTGLHRLCTVVRDTICTNDNQTARLITPELLTYVTLIATYYRMMLVAAKFGNIATDIPKVAKQIHDIKLPVFLCNYIESIGSVIMANGATVVPYIAQTLDDLLDIRRIRDNLPLAMRRNYQFVEPDRYYTDHRQFVDHIMQTINRDNEGRLEVYDPSQRDEEDQTAWHINARIIQKYKQNLRTDKIGLNFRTVNYEELTGRQEMLVSFDSPVAGAIIPTAPEIMPVDSAALGAVYMFRNSDTRSWLPTNGEHLISGRTFIGYAVEDVGGLITQHTRATSRV